MRTPLYPYFRQHRREDYLTKKIPINYDPKARCPQFSKFLAETFRGSVALIGYVTRLAGYFLTGFTTEQKWWVFYGPTASGKSSFIRILHGILGPYAHALPENYFLLSKNNPTDFETAHLHGVRLASCVETNEGRRLDVARIKKITGEDTIRAALKFQNSFEFQPQCKLVLVTNHRPHVPAGDDALWRRLKVVPFTVTVPEENRIPGLAEKLLREEAPGILNWAVAGCHTWQMNGLQDPPEVAAAVDEYRSSEDVVKNFLAECCVRDPTAQVLRKQTYGKYVDWSKENMLHPMTKDRFGKELVRLGVKKDAGDRFWLGIRFQDVLI
jgi:putative DNA primase/helicase